MCDQTACTAVIVLPIGESDVKLKSSKGNSAGQGPRSRSFVNVDMIVWPIMAEYGTGRWDKIRPTALKHYKRIKRSQKSYATF